MTYKLFLDDEREPIGHEWFVARDFDEAITLVRAWGLPQLVSFDHDLGDGPTGKDFAGWLVEYMLDHQDQLDLQKFSYTIHSQNPVGAENIRSLMDRFIQFSKEKDVDAAEPPQD